MHVSLVNWRLTNYDTLSPSWTASALVNIISGLNTSFYRDFKFKALSLELTGCHGYLLQGMNDFEGTGYFIEAS